VSQVCDVLEHIHGQEIVHRDLKGENTILLGRSGVDVRVIDFGLAKTPDMPGQVKLTMPGQAIGSPEYMSPEQILSSGEVDVQADLWAVGVLAYVALSLEFPFKSSNLVELLQQLQSASFTPASQLHPGLGPEVDAWFARAFHLEKLRRFQSAKEMADGWSQAAAGSAAEPIAPAAPVLAPVTLAPAAGGSGRVVAVAAIAALLLLVAVALILSL
jgi:serine/threonine-protein kinase